MTEVLADRKIPQRVCRLAGVLLLLAGCVVRADSLQQLLDALPQQWAGAASAGDVDTLMTLYSPEAYIHVVFTQEELHGETQIRDYYHRYSQQKPTVTITGLEDNSILNESVGILSGFATVEFPGQTPIETHFSIVGAWQDQRWKIKLQTTVRVYE